MKIKKYWHCPRCGMKVPILENRCPECRLLRDRLKKATNTAAKKAFKNREYNKVIYYNVLPPDINKLHLLLWAIFLGWIGIHYIRVGRIKMATYMMVSFFLILLFTILNTLGVFPSSIFTHKYLGLLAWGMIIPACFALVFWVVSVFQIIFGHFKVPIAIDEEYFVSSGSESEF